ncbi:MAG: RnfABCDGE type electron transport complex subunit D [Leptotrichiaceae bacterium]|nr:RnfABCDGE type electron transport complex subunit D [Leptotrichiaceae bacterium]MBP6281660.1 RnfABCDGE type electron transport complex subunit D [Leptotrichiaceae bacterium]MBP7100028.1 RnfABCDGE type electron transport complex subunit D [Leptotrichiaceae bacterium]MBP7725375.1 RnfABCDGE type electron transport complex subunit D [Leptotrichiaceae bacterium]MBP9628951.1 RnfABCDGE type electron transport complex subunit D [Leptotrichiaceae bacterium]
MKIIFKRTTPTYRNSLNTKKVMFHLTLALLIVSIISVGYYFSLGIDYGIKSILMIAVSVLFTYVCEIFYYFLLKEKNIIETVNNSFYYVTGILFALILPIGTPYYVVIFGSIFAILIGKLIFGGFGQNIFNPALIGRAFVMMSYGDKLTTTLPNKVVDGLSSPTPTTILSGTQWMGSSEVPLSNLYLGFYKGSIGESFAILIIILGIYLAWKKVLDWRMPVFYIGSSFIISFIAGLFHGLNPLIFALVNIGIGGLIFGGVFMVTDPVTSPSNPFGKIIFSIGAAFFTMLLRFSSNMPEGVLYSILIMNMLTPMIDKYTIVPTNKNENKKLLFIIMFILVSSLLVTLVWKGA